MEFKYKIKNDDFVGEILINIPTISEQFKILKEIQIVADKDGKTSFSSQLDSMEKQLELCQKYVKSVSIEHIKSKTIFKSLDEMLYFKQAKDLLLEDCVSFIVNGIDLGKL